MSIFPTIEYKLARTYLIAVIVLFSNLLGITQGGMVTQIGDTEISLSLGPEQMTPGSKIQLNLQNTAAMPFACSGPGNQSVGGFNQCADQSNAIIKTDRNNFFVCCSPPGWLPSEAYEYNFPSIQSIYPCVAGANVDELIITITINSVVFDLGSPFACCEQYFEGVFGNIYDNCPGGTCPVAADGIANNGNPGMGDCAPNGDNLNYNAASSSFPLGLPYTATTTCMAGQISTTDLLGVDIVPSFRYDLAAANGCNCPTDLISQGLVTIDYDIDVEFVFCSNDLPAGCFPSAFMNVGPLCETDPAVVLPTTSTNGISGTWNPASINPAGQGGNTITAIFTPNPGQCVTGTSEMEVVINAATVPTFDPIGPLCETDPAVPLPTTSTNGINGTWDVGGSFDPTGQGGNTVTITFTPNAGQCAASTTLDIVVNSGAVPTFNNIGPLCENAAPVPLPGTSTNGINGTWDVGGSFDPSGQGGNTVTITFTPNVGQCASSTTMDVVVNAETIPTFSQIGPICESASPVPLPGASTNGVNGTWDVGGSFDPSGQGGNTVTITFTPNAGQCASVATMDIVVETESIPLFDPIGPVCESEPPIPLPSASNNGISGTWDVGGSFDPSGQGGNTVTLTFTPDVGECATSATLDVQVLMETVPSFNPIGPLCETQSPVALPSTSLNGVMGTWDVGPTFNPFGQGGNTVTITFTPNAGQCASATTLDIIVNQAAQPSFSPIGPLCENDSPVALPSTSLNGISGTWDVGPTFNPTGAGGTTVTITFTPGPGECGNMTTMDIIVDAETVPSFAPIGPLCENDMPVNLPSTSLNGVPGSWDIGPFFDPSGLGGTTTNIVFTPNTGECASNETVAVLVNEIPQNTILEISCSANLIDYFVDFQTDGDNVSSTAGNVINLGGGDFTVENIPEGTNVTITVTNTASGCSSSFDVTSPSCNCPTIDPPIGNDVEICEGETIPALTVTVGAGFNVDWYDAATNGTLLLANSTNYTPTGAGTYFAETVDPNSNCTSNTRTGIQLTILPVDTTFVQDSSCNSMEVGIDTTIFATALCDSVVITTTTLIPGEEVFQMATSCDPNNIGMDTLFLMNQAGCDSLVITETTLSPADTSFFNATTCDPMMVGIDTTVFTTATCDSVVITTTTLLAGDETFLNATSCDSSIVGLDTVILSNQLGCDSLVITETTFVPLPTTFNQATSCDPMQVGMDTTIFNSGGCDSIVIIEITLSAADTTFVPMTTCDVSQVGVDTTVFTTATCDSIVITTTTLLQGDMTFLQDTSCDLTVIGLDTLVLQNQAGCDSLIVTETIFEGLPPTFEQATTCDPQMVGVDTTVFSSQGCDSLVITTTTLLPSDVIFLNDTSCDPMQVGVDTVFLTNQNGCDSLVITNTTQSAADTTFVTASSCDPAQVGIDTTIFSTPLCDSIVITTTTLLASDETLLMALTCDPMQVGLDTVFLFNQNGCDSLVITSTELDFIPPTFVPASTCLPSEVGIDTIIFSTATCDSIVIVNTSLLPSSEFTISEITCIPAEAGIDTTYLTNYLGCDSLVITNVTLAGGITSIDVTSINPSCLDPFGSIEIDNVEGGDEPYLFSIDGGQQFVATGIFSQLEAGNYEIIVEDVNGCQIEMEEILSGEIEPEIFIDPDLVELNLGESYSINPTLTIPDTSVVFVEWTPGENLDCVNCINTVATPLQSTTQTISIVDENGCTASATISFVIDENVRVYVPNAFSPNGDGINDSFTILGDENQILMVDELRIYDRWGGNVFENYNFQVNDFLQGWDGTQKGEEMNQGVYVYLAFVTLVNGEQVMIEGDITLTK